MVQKSFLKEQKENMRDGKGTVTLNHWIKKGNNPPHCRLAATLVLPPGASIGGHTHECEAEVFFVEQGSAIYDDNGKSVQARQGDVLYCAAGESHSIENVGEGDLVVQAVIITE